MIWKRLEYLFNQGHSDEPESAKNLLHSPAAISDLLSQYQSQNHLLTASHHSNHNSSSPETPVIIVEVDSGKRRFRCVSTSDQKTDNLRQPEDVMEFTVSMDEAQHRFKADLLATGSATANPVGHWFRFPQGIEQIQNRGAFRLKLSQAHPIEVTITTGTGPSCSGTLVDLSSTGMRIRHQGQPTITTGCGETFESCSWILEDGNRIHCQGQLIHWTYDDESGVGFLGIKFRAMDAAMQRILNRYLAQQQRKKRRISKRHSGA